MKLQHYASSVNFIVPSCQETEVIFTKSLLPEPPSVLTTDSMTIKRWHHDYNSNFRADALHLSAHKSSLRALGLLILARLFHDRPERITLEFSSPASDIHRLVLDPFVSNKRGIDYTTTPNCFYYFVENTDKHPWLKTAIDPWDFPMFSLSNAEEMITTEADWKNRDTVFGLGSDLAHVRFAQLLLNASYPDNFINEYALEGEAGFRGVAPTSAELHIWLPGSIGYDTALSQETEP